MPAPQGQMLRGLSLPDLPAAQDPLLILGSRPSKVFGYVSRSRDAETGNSCELTLLRSYVQGLLTTIKAQEQQINSITSTPGTLLFNPDDPDEASTDLASSSAPITGNPFTHGATPISQPVSTPSTRGGLNVDGLSPSSSGKSNSSRRGRVLLTVYSSDREGIRSRV